MPSRTLSEELSKITVAWRRSTTRSRQNSIKHVDELFNLPKETNLRFIDSDPENPYNGYLANLPCFPFHEAMAMEVGGAGCFDPSVILKLADLMWPEGNAYFRDNMNSYLSKLAEVDKMVKKMVFRSLRLETEYLDHDNEATGYSLRLLRYKPVDQDGLVRIFTPKEGFGASALKTFYSA